jgi:AraC-like DNA-binding protein
MYYLEPVSVAPAAADPPLVDSLRRSTVFQDYQRAFEVTTGLPLTLKAADALGLAHGGARHQNLFCALMSAHNRSCSACLEAQQRVRECAVTGARTVVCPAGFLESGVPVVIGEKVVAYLHIGQVLPRRPSHAQFERTLVELGRRGVQLDHDRARAAYFGTRVIEARQYDAMLRLLAIFARHLAVISNQIMLTSHPVDSPLIARAKAFIADHADEPLSLALVARAVNTSTFYFCKVFRRSTGLKFVDYVGRLRLERVKRLLLNPHSNISEAAYAAGFTSLSQFNRIFRRVIGEEPRHWREKQLAHQT